MDHLDDVGLITFSLKRAHWIIPHYYNLPQIASTGISSPRFRFAGRNWKMFVFPNGCHWDSSFGWFGISVINESFDSGEKLIIRLGIAGQSQEKVVSSRADTEGDGNYHLFRLMRRSVLESNKDHMVPGGNLHVFFYIEREFANLGANAVVQEKIERGEKKPENNTSNFNMEASSESEAEICVKKLQDDLKEFLLSENISDVTLKVKDREFRAHRSILAARSSVFLAMMKHDTKEKATGVVDIDDVDSNTFSDFLVYIYTGSLEHLTTDNVPNLYVTADKYELNELKNACLNYMLKNISLENFCSVLTLSIRHDEKKLFDVCVNFFLENSLQIVLTSKWQEFLIENPIVGNELFIKHLRMKV